MSEKEELNPGRTDPGGAGWFPESYYTEYNRFGGRVQQAARKNGKGTVDKVNEPLSSGIQGDRRERE